jgi:hypothetical protein
LKGSISKYFCAKKQINKVLLVIENKVNSTENQLIELGLSSISEIIKLLLKKAKKYAFSFSPFSAFNKTIQTNKNTKISVTQLLEIRVLSIACTLFGFVRLIQN